jgi:hypothetical protein
MVVYRVAGNKVDDISSKLSPGSIVVIAQKPQP